MKLRRLAALLAGCVGVLAIGSAFGADEKAVDLKVGDAAPSFQAKDDQGKSWKSSEHVGKKLVVVYFYPADLTPGCTAEACTYRDDMKKLAANGIDVVGISGDSVKNHQIFKEVKQLNFTLLADEDGKIAKTFGVPTRPGGVFNTKDAAGNPVALKRGITASRWTFVIGKDGKIVHKNTMVNPIQDSKEILAVVEKLPK